MTDYKPGTVAVATVRGVPDVRVFLSQPDSRGGGFSVWRHTEVRGDYYSHDHQLSDIRPLVVLDVDYTPEVRDNLLRLLREHYFHSTADQIEAQTKPPRIPEPGLWGVVKASTATGIRKAWVHHSAGLWFAAGLPALTWDDLIDPVLIREGVEG